MTNTMKTFSTRRARSVIAVAAALLTFAGGVAEARVGQGGSFGSRGSRTYTAPPATRTAPETGAPIQRSQTPQNQFQRPGVPPTATVAQPRRFGFGTGLFAGLLGAGLLGMLFGHGFFGGLAGIGSFLGLLIQIALLAWLVSLAVRWFRRRQEPAAAGVGSYGRSPAGGSVPPAGGGLAGALGGALGGMGMNRGRVQDAPRPAGRRDEVGIGDRDFATFERRLHEVQDAYSRGDVSSLWNLATPEMAGYLQEELNDNARKGVVNTVSDVRLLQGDLAEAWREGDTDYATVAMRYSLVDQMVERDSGRVVQGGPDEATEVWTFMRVRGGHWLVSAIQQT
jgi:predicted lipid-binding transport protein (Tim44 family)